MAEITLRMLAVRTPLFARFREPFNARSHMPPETTANRSGSGDSGVFPGLYGVFPAGRAGVRKVERRQLIFKQVEVRPDMGRVGPVRTVIRRSVIRQWRSPPVR